MELDTDDEGIGRAYLLDGSYYFGVDASYNNYFGSDDSIGEFAVSGKDIDVKPGQSATVVITAETRKDVLLLPLSVIAGRQGKGMVTVINDGKQIQTEVMLGATDGAYIEILSGVNEGDTISSIPPNLDPRSKE